MQGTREPGGMYTAGRSTGLFLRAAAGEEYLLAVKFLPLLFKFSFLLYF